MRILRQSLTVIRRFPRVVVILAFMVAIVGARSALLAATWSGDLTSPTGSASANNYIYDAPRSRVAAGVSRRQHGDSEEIISPGTSKRGPFCDLECATKGRMKQSYSKTVWGLFHNTNYWCVYDHCTENFVEVPLGPGTLWVYKATCWFKCHKTS
jgi:hypothetical protein